MNRGTARAAACALLIFGGGWSALGASPVRAADEGVCAGQSSGKIDVSGSHTTLTVVAPEGQLISGYCVKAGSINNENGPVYVSVNPPAAQVTISHPSGKDISHYSVLYVASTPAPAVTDVCSNLGGDQPTVPAGMTRVNGECVESSPPAATDVCSNLADDQPTVPAGMTRVNGECVEPQGAGTPVSDVCPNMDGVQATVPNGFVISDNQCVPVVPAPAPAPAAVVGSLAVVVPAASPVDGSPIVTPAAPAAPAVVGSLATPLVNPAVSPVNGAVASASRPAAVPSSGGETLPSTGTTSSLLLAAATVTLLLGVGTLRIARRKQHAFEVS